MMGAMTQPRPTRERIMDSANDLVLQKGFSATTLDDILSAAEASKGAFFHHFPSKEALGDALLHRYAEADERLLEHFVALAEAASDDPAEQVVAFVGAFEDAADEMAQSEPGCLFASFIYERGPQVPPDDDVIIRSIETWRARLLHKLELAAATRPALRDMDLTAVADQVFVVFEGGFILVRATGDPSHLRRQLALLRHEMAVLLGVASVTSAPDRGKARSTR
jgi:TetR/AcrR family transcriptional regulator, transcriptional repressor for nem operon